jgi:ABC-2 type transport system ATP-binding protein
MVPKEKAAMSAIVVEKLSKRYGARLSVNDLTFEVPTGVVCGFIGQNGAGKTTTIRLLLGLVSPTHGTASVLGHSIDNPHAYLPRVGAMIEGPAFYPTLTARQNLRVLSRLAGIEDSQIEVVLARVDLFERGDEQYRTFSLGMKQRLGIAAALLPRPEVLILDEPTNGLDPQGIREIRSLLRGLADEGLTVLVSSHLLDELQHVVDHVVLIDRGRLCFDGTIHELLDRQSPSLVVRANSDAQNQAVLEVCRSVGVAAVIDGDAVRVHAPEGFAAELNRLCHGMGVSLRHLGIERVRLEDVFFSLTSDDAEQS